MMGVGAIVRDHERQVIAIMCSSIKCGRGLCGMEGGSVILDCDVLKIVHALHREEQSWSKHETLIDDYSKIILPSFHS